MTVQTAVSDLQRTLHDLRDELLALRLTVREDAPRSGEHVLVDIYGDRVDDLLGWLEEAVVALERSRQGPDEGDSAHLWQGLIQVQAQAARLHDALCDLTAYDRLGPLLHHAREEGGEWRGWVRSLRTGVERCRLHLYNLDQALLQCWREAAERTHSGLVSVHNTTIGQQTNYNARHHVGGDPPTSDQAASSTTDAGARLPYQPETTPASPGPGKQR